MSKEQQSENGAEELPPFYKSITPLFSETHKRLRIEKVENYAFAADATAIVLAAEEFSLAERDYAIVFSKGKHVMPVILTGLPGERNQFVCARGRWTDGAYIPAYVRRYPFLLAKIEPNASDLSLCFDLESKFLVERKEGNLFDGDKPSAQTENMLRLCQWYEGAIARTQRFVEKLTEYDLLIDAEATFQHVGQKPVAFRGFQIVSEQKVQNLSAAQLQDLSKSGALGLVHAHHLSLKNMEKLFADHGTDKKASETRPTNNDKK